MSVRKELLERELNKLGFHKAGESAPSHRGGTTQQQQQPQPQGGEHPKADDGGGSHSE